MPAYRQRYGRLLSCTVACEGLSPEGFLAAAAGDARFYWASGDGSSTFAGAGCALELQAWGTARYTTIAEDARELFADAALLGDAPPLARPRLFGGFAFRADFEPDHIWSIYSPAWFLLPHYQLLCQNKQQWLTINTHIPPEEAAAPLLSEMQAALRAKIAQLHAVNAAPMPANTVRSTRYPMSAGQWQRMLQAAREAIHKGRLRKIVLARAAELRFTRRVELLPVLRDLAAHYANCTRFLFEPRPHQAFYGATPELLAALQGRQLQSMALAGSAARGINSADDARLGAALLCDPKELAEHDIVVEKMRQRLLPMTRKLELGQRRLLQLHNIQHLHSPISGELHGTPGILPVLAALHPTPALGGAPRAQALPLIRELEPIPRGWYGAPIGWLDAELQGEFAVAIRSAVAQEDRVWVYAGAGIVADSQPEQEWQETALKFRPMLAAHAAPLCT